MPTVFETYYANPVDATYEAIGNLYVQLSGDAAAQSNLTAAASAASNWINPLKVPDTIDTLALANKGLISKPQFVRLVGFNGHAFTTADGMLPVIKFENQSFQVSSAGLDPLQTVWDKQAMLYRYKPSLNEIFLMENREMLSGANTEYLVKEVCGKGKVWVDWYRELAKETPGPSDLVRFAVREAFNPTIVAQYDYHKEIPTNILPFFKRQGLGWNIGSVMPEGATDHDGNPIEGPETFFHKYWYSHWDIPSPTQGYDMLHRLYPSSDYGPSPDLRPGHEFRDADMATLLKVLDYPEYWRQKLIAISYHPINTTDIKDMHRLDVGTTADIYHAYRRQGYNDADTKRLIELAEKKKLRNLGLDPGKVAKGWICSHWQDAMLTDTEARTLMMNNGFTVTQAQAMLSKCKLDFQTKINRQYMQGIRQGIISGVFSKADALSYVSFLGVNPVTYEQKVDLWIFQRDTRYKLAAVKQLMQAHAAGAINDALLNVRLFNLGYTDVDRSIMLRTAQNLMADKVNKALLAAAKAKIAAAQKLAESLKKTTQQAIKDAAAKTKAAQKKVDDRARKIASVSNDENIQEWYDAGLITLVDVYYRLFMRRFGLADADRWVQELDPSLSAGSMALAKSKAATIYHSEGNQPIATFEPAESP